MKGKRLIFSLSCCIFLLFQGCSSNNASTPTSPPEPQVISSTATQEATETILSPTTMPSATTVSELVGQVKVVSLNLRDGPGTVHNVLGNYPNGTGLVILSQTPNGEWVKVKTNDDQVGWMYRSLLKIDGDWQALPQEESEENIKITGQVLSNTGTPVNDITIACAQTINEVEKKNDALTGEDGLFIIYLPSNSTGSWSVQVAGVGCDSWIATEDCEYTGYFENYGQALIELPQTEPVIFIYQE